MRGRNNNNRGGKGGNQLNRSFESNGPDVKIRGTAAHIADKYVQLARDAQSSGDPISAENYLQHAEHYYRIVAANQPQYPQNPGQGFVRADDESRDEEGDEAGEARANGFDGGQQGEPRPPQQNYAQNAPQPYEQRDNQQRDHRQQNHRQQNEGGGLPDFITGGGGDQGQGQDRGDRDFRNNRRNNRRFNNRYGRNGGPGEHGNGPEAAAPGAEPEVTPGE
jgi:hypothetical protein